jgi:RimJ/RimL family protein N-acetyltransferase
LDTIGGSGRIIGMDAVELRQGPLLLRPWRATDAETVRRACQDPDIRRWTGVPRPYRLDHAVDFVTTHTERAWATRTAAPLGVFDAATGEMLGSGGLVALDLVGATGELGYWVAPWARGRGIAAEAVRAVARWAFDDLGLRRLVWQAEVGNHRSRLVALRTGVRPEGLLRQALIRPDGTRADGWIGSLLPGDLRPVHPAHPAIQDGTAADGCAVCAADRLAARRAAVFTASQPNLTATTRDGSRITLRAPDERDIDAIVSACHDAESGRWTTIPMPYTTDDANEFVHAIAPRAWARGTGGVFAIAGPDGSYAGSMDLRIGDADHADIDSARFLVGDVGYLIAPWARGRGFGSAALATVCDWGFDALGLDRIEWRAYVGNDASRRTALRAGFTIEGTARGHCVQRGYPRDAWTGAVMTTDRAAHHQGRLG